MVDLPGPIRMRCGTEMTPLIPCLLLMSPTTSPLLPAWLANARKPDTRDCTTFDRIVSAVAQPQIVSYLASHTSRQQQHTRSLR